jgi:adenylate cyclase
MRKSIGLKILSVALLMALLMAVVAGISSWHLDEVSDEAIELAHYYIPIQQRAHMAARHASAELVHFERYLNLRRSGAAPEVQQKERAAIKQRADDADRVIAEAVALVGAGERDGEISIASPKFAQLRAELPQIARAHRDMSETVQEYLKQAEAGDERLTAVFEERLAKQRTSVSDEINDVTVLLDALTTRSAEDALALEEKARISTWSVTAAAVLIGLVLAGMITRVLVRPVQLLVEGTRAVRDGNLNVDIKVDSTDEIGTLAASFNHMIGGLKQKETIQNTFGKYVDPRIVKSLIENDSSFAHAGEKRRMSVFFSDIAGFTSLSERLAPEDLVRFLNRYFTLMSQPIRDGHGIIDKYIGDSIMAFWGPPFVDAEQHAIAACRAAIAQMACMEAFRAELPRLLPGVAIPDGIRTRIGIATGEVTVGNIGSDASKGYTVVGDTVNLAARLESAGKQYGVQIIISEDTFTAAREAIEARELDQIRVVGKSAPARIFEVLGMKGETEQARRELAQAYEAALLDFRGGSLAQARAGFTQALARVPGDKASQVFLDRIELLERTGLPTGWDGVWTLTEK